LADVGLMVPSHERGFQKSSRALAFSACSSNPFISLEARAGVALTQDLEGRPILGELLRDTALGRDDGLLEMLGLLVLRGGNARGTPDSA
jgi:hypothetical protein